LRDALHVELPPYSEVRLQSADLNDIQPAEYRADLVVLLYEDLPVLGIVVEAQLQRDDDKPYTWPVYATGLRARIKCPVCLLVVTVHEAVAKWAARSIDLGNPVGDPHRYPGLRCLRLRRGNAFVRARRRRGVFLCG
jgi:hypothetical protein